MKQAKFALTAVAVLAVIGGALAFKANRIANRFFGYTTSNIAGQVTGVCTVPTTLLYQTDAAGPILLTLSNTTVTGVTTCTVRVKVTA